MRIGFLGPCGESDDLDALEKAATFLLVRENVARAVYLGNDGALDRCVTAWVARLAFDDPTDEAAWRRAADVAASGTFEQIDSFVVSERERLRLRALATLPDDAPYVLETLGNVRTLMTANDSSVDDVDANDDSVELVVVGHASAPRLEEIDSRWVLHLGSIGRGGIAVLDAQSELAIVTVYDSSEREVLRVVLREPDTAAR